MTIELNKPHPSGSTIVYEGEKYRLKELLKTRVASDQEKIVDGAGAKIKYVYEVEFYNRGSHASSTPCT